jgi:DnaJ-class molecular chaperone
MSETMKDEELGRKPCQKCGGSGKMERFAQFPHEMFVIRKITDPCGITLQRMCEFCWGHGTDWWAVPAKGEMWGLRDKVTNE